MTADTSSAAPDGSSPQSEFWPADGNDYRAASVCRRGHVQASNLEGHPARLGRCPDCGANVLGSCLRCGLRIRGTSRAVVPRPGSTVAAGYVPPNCCDGCGAPHPWAPREALLFELENLLDEDGIDDADRLIVADHLRRLRELDPDEDVEQEGKAWKAVKRRAPQLFAGPGKLILSKLIDRATQKMLGMEP